jgi:hypothetical protein
VDLVTQLRDRGHEVPPFAVRDNTLAAGPVLFRHERHATHGLTAGVHLDGVVIDPDDYVTAIVEVAGY